MRAKVGNAIEGLRGLISSMGSKGFFLKKCILVTSEIFQTNFFSLWGIEGANFSSMSPARDVAYGKG